MQRDRRQERALKASQKQTESRWGEPFSRKINNVPCRLPCRRTRLIHAFLHMHTLKCFHILKLLLWYTFYFFRSNRRRFVVSSFVNILFVYCGVIMYIIVTTKHTFQTRKVNLWRTLIFCKYVSKAEHQNGSFRNTYQCPRRTLKTQNIPTNNLHLF